MEAKCDFPHTAYIYAAVYHIYVVLMFGWIYLYVRGGWRWAAAPAGIATCQAFADRPTTITDSLSVYISYVMSQERIYPRSLARGRLDSF